MKALFAFWIAHRGELAALLGQHVMLVTASTAVAVAAGVPLGIFSVGERRRRAGVAIGDYVLDLVGIAELLDEDWREDLSQPVLNGWLARGHEAHLCRRPQASPPPDLSRLSSGSAGEARASRRPGDR